MPALLLCYFIPGIYNSIGLIDGANSKLYNPVASRVLLPAALVLLTLTIDLKGVLQARTEAAADVRGRVDQRDDRRVRRRSR